jgi:hypothetical protein
VEYVISGKLVATTTQLPWSASIDFTPYKGKTIEITVKAYSNGKNQPATTQKVKVTVK